MRQWQQATGEAHRAQKGGGAESTMGDMILGSLTLYFRPVSLVGMLIMVVPGAVGLALVAKHL